MEAVPLPLGVLLGSWLCSLMLAMGRAAYEAPRSSRQSTTPARRMTRGASIGSARRIGPGRGVGDELDYSGLHEWDIDVPEPTGALP